MESRPRVRRAEVEDPGGPAFGERGGDGVGGAPGQFRADLVLGGPDDHPAPRRRDRGDSETTQDRGIFRQPPRRKNPSGHRVLRPREPRRLSLRLRPKRPPGGTAPLDRSRDNPGVRVSKTLDPAGLPLRPAGDAPLAVTE